MYFPVLTYDTGEEDYNLSLEFILTTQRWINNKHKTKQSWMKKVWQLKDKKKAQYIHDHISKNTSDQR